MPTTSQMQAAWFDRCNAARAALPDKLPIAGSLSPLSTHPLTKEKPSQRQKDEMRRAIRLHKAIESQRARELDLLLTAGVALPEALQIVGKG